MPSSLPIIAMMTTLIMIMMTMTTMTSLNPEDVKVDLHDLQHRFKKGGNALYKVSKTFIRNLTILLILIIIAILAYNFYIGSAPYGDLENSLESQAFSPTFLAYAAVAAIVIFCEIIALFRSMTKERIRDEYGVHWEDVGRGRNSFIILYICSYAAFLFGDFIPENIEILPVGIEILKGIKGALAVFGSLHNQLFGLCVAGVVSCVIRKYRR